MSGQPLVAVLTPVYNGEDFLAECIESVLSQTYADFEYLIVNNCSADRTLEIASRYAAKDRRIHVSTNANFVGVIENHNIAFRAMSASAKYCKVVSADDLIFPDCIRQLVEVAEAHPGVGIVGSYQLSGSRIRWEGFEYPAAVFPGTDVCRRVFLGGDPTFGFGTPTSILYRADIVRAAGECFYPNASPHADTSACFQSLAHSDFGFAHQVLSYERTHAATQSTASARLNRYASAYLNDLIQYGSLYLTKGELERCLSAALLGYHRFLAVNIGRFRDPAFRQYHTNRLKELGYPLQPTALLKAGVIAACREALNPEQAIRKLRRRMSA